MKFHLIGAALLTALSTSALAAGVAVQPADVVVPPTASVAYTVTPARDWIVPPHVINAAKPAIDWIVPPHVVNAVKPTIDWIVPPHVEV